MKIKVLMLTVLLLTITSIGLAQAKKKPVKVAAAVVTPEQVVKNLYAEHKAGKGPFFQTKNRALVDKYFARNLADAIWKDAVDSAAGGGVGALDSDPLFYAQDTQITNFVIGKADENNSVKVKFKNMGKDEEITYFLAKENTASKVWKIDSIMYSDAEDLGAILEYGTMTEEEMKKADAEYKLNGEYMIGAVKCSVETNKSGYWARVKCDDQPNFQVIDTESLTFGTFNPNEKGRRGKFVFTDETFTSGEFIDASGKKTKVVRVKS